QAGEIRLNLGVGKSGVPEVGLLDKDERSGLILTLTPDGSFVMDFDRGGKSLLALTVTPEGASSMQFLDKDEKSRFVVGLSKDGAPMCGAFDKDRKARVGMT